MTGTLVNAAAVLAGGSLGLLLHSRIPQRLSRAAFEAIGLFTLALGFSMAIRTHSFLVVILSVVVGALVGSAVHLERGAERIGDRLRARLGSRDSRFTEGMVSAFMLFCMGSMTVLGALEEGLGNGCDLLLAKSLLDGFASLALASAMGVGVLFAIFPLLLYQGGLTLLGRLLEGGLPVAAVDEMSAVGGVLLLGLGIRILELRKVSVLDLLPALPLAVLFHFLL
ncbi:DUF554 domain-containing protein [Candidatus Fermentibacterales bacterium]|nr:DUF554 domain-containing protein [Candidatus Fermentibacterales bacterium]